MPNSNEKYKSNHQGAPEMENLKTEFGEEISSGDNNKGTKYRSKKGSKSKVTKKR